MSGPDLSVRKVKTRNIISAITEPLLQDTQANDADTYYKRGMDIFPYRCRKERGDHGQVSEVMFTEADKTSWQWNKARTRIGGVSWKGHQRKW